MPDRNRRTVSASEVAALFGESPYCTRWLLWQSFANGVDISQAEDGRMREGRRMQPLVLERAAEDMKLVIEPNESNAYVTRGPLGCTRDAIVIHPERGPGALEVKVVFDYRQWMERWSGGKSVPREYELQLQTQMFVGDGEHANGGGGSYAWGMFAVWVCGDYYYFERTPQPELWTAMEREATSFLRSVVERREPNPAGAILELPLIAELYPLVQGKVLDMRDHYDGELYVTKARTAERSKDTANTHKGVYDSLRAEFIALMKDCDTLLLPDGARVHLGNGRRISFYVPEVANG